MAKVKIIQIRDGYFLDSKGRIWYREPVYTPGHGIEGTLSIVGYKWKQLDLPEES